MTQSPESNEPVSQVPTHTASNPDGSRYSPLVLGVCALALFAAMSMGFAHFLSEAADHMKNASDADKEHALNLALFQSTAVGAAGLLVAAISSFLDDSLGKLLTAAAATAVVVIAVISAFLVSF